MFRALIHVANGDNSRFISINIFKFVIVIIRYLAALAVFTTHYLTEGSCLVILNAVEDTSAHYWLVHLKSSEIGDLLAIFSGAYIWIHLWE